MIFDQECPLLLVLSPGPDLDYNLRRSSHCSTEAVEFEKAKVEVLSRGMLENGAGAGPMGREGGGLTVERSITSLL